MGTWRVSPSFDQARFSDLVIDIGSFIISPNPWIYQYLFQNYGEWIYHLVIWIIG